MMVSDCANAPVHGCVVSDMRGVDCVLQHRIATDCGVEDVEAECKTEQVYEICATRLSRMEGFHGV